MFFNSQKIRVAINGFGRIGRGAFKVLLNNNKVEVVGINDLTDTRTLEQLLRYDSVYGKYGKNVSSVKDAITVDGKNYPVFAIKEPQELPWKKLAVDAVLECTGRFTDKESSLLHLSAGAKKVIISAPAKSDEIKTIVLGVNENKITKSDKIISLASCTTNCLAPITDVINKNFGIKKAIMSTVHAYTADQNLVDGPHHDLRRARAAAFNIVPTTTGAAVAVTKAIPALAGKFDGLALRVPVICGSICDAVYVVNKQATEHQINEALRKASGGRLKGILAVSNEPLVSSDIIGNPASAIVDLPLTRVIGGDLMKIVAWYDNEWGYSNRLAEAAEYFGKL
ncbi:type I glyceraldehyde-3-phosphate dehydrogenase [Candidatus Falkowbacteria bacterium CG10_big_fil_rev_8_21_14_0_10_43_11]|uniref:Glyceraldehyde-3-phosphate dehydrogenase n=1 Tax=Candidatus Falkowbacteria bacterium CG10_big_fil_rev_8_21_14_0_10_43_11 TaxID=1974568 RepID=A0A2M6WKV9_9BACT|nr:MAG: type I glyceraldehyde-3-phosphate dehydrogenase [Candidatus Falkowbacteria bacterium CG10_big_fil_rev_8_21_14_0_10_43_11]